MRAAAQKIQALIHQGRWTEASVLARQAVLKAPDNQTFKGLVQFITNKQQQLTGYQIGVLKNRLTPYLDFPKTVKFEMHTVCNASCTFCPYSTLERKGTKMSDGLIAKILGDLQDIPKKIPFTVSPFGVNEPFLDGRFFNILAEINEKLPQAKIEIISNGNALTDKKMDQLEKVQNISTFKISCNDHRKENYEETMQLSYDKTIERLDELHKRKVAGRLYFDVFLSRVGDDTPADSAFLKWYRARYPLFKPMVAARGTWLNQVDCGSSAIPNVGCMQWFNLSIISTGLATICCHDGRAQHAIGDVKKQHIIDIYNNPQYRKWRETAASRLDGEPCRSCARI
ncbi:MAG: radical SAM/SPASM domain-containing protein [Alphaproteobacteria bacterium]